MFEKVLIANRGEIAVRVTQACRELDVTAVAVYSDADADAKHVRVADEAVNVGPSAPRNSYLDQERVLDAAREAGVDAIHPGYGFLSENPTFAARVEDSEFVWIGPPSEVMEQLSEKTRARQIMSRAGVPIVPGTTEPVTDVAEVYEFGDEHGYPLVIKADGGGGGRGLKVVPDESAVETQFQAARREGEAYFDNPTVYLERYLESSRHVEVQVLADTHGNVRHLGERDCSIQRRQQKLIEETPCPALGDEVRAELCESARQGVAEAGYVNAGTVEFLYEDGEFFFLEVNSRIQVEHPITEVVTGIDLVKWQIRVAAGEELSFSQDEVLPRGAAMEFRINAEDPDNDFAPLPGTVETYRPPRGIGVRVDDAIDQGDAISPFYDSMFAKYVVYGENREEVLRRGRRAFAEAEIEGVPTTIPFHRRLLTDDGFVDDEHDTRYVESVLLADESE